MPAAHAIINPKVIVANLASVKYLSGVGVAYKLAQALLESFNKRDYLDKILYLVAVGTIADVVPLLEENRILVYQGLKLISQKRPVGLIKLLEIAGCKFDNGVSSEMIGFAVAPRINAVGRLKEADLAVELLITEDNDEAESLAKKLNHENKNRQQFCEVVFLEADQMVSELDLEINRAIILAHHNWHPGIIGVVASKLVEKYNKPVFLISLDEENKEARCSARSIDGLHLYEALNVHSDLFNHFGGHALAAGFALDLEKLGIEEFIEILHSTINDKFDASIFNSSLKLDLDIDSEDLTVNFVNELDKLAPFGEGNPSPVLSISNLKLKEYKTMGASKNHLKLILADNKNKLLEAVWWQKNSLDIAILDSVDVAFSPRINNFAGKTIVQLDIKAIRLNSQSDSNSVNKDEKNDFYKEPRWIDHRKRTGIEKIFSNYLKTSKDNIIIFAENPETIQNFEKDPVCQSRIVNRLNIQQADQLILFDFPSDAAILSEIINESKAKIIHLVGSGNNELDPKFIIRKLSGMLKFAYSHRDGIINIDEIASKLYLSNKAVLVCIKLLYQAGMLDILQETKEFIKLKFIKSVDISSIINLREYEDLLFEIQNIVDFKFQLSADPIEKIKDLVTLPLELAI